MDWMTYVIIPFLIFLARIMDVSIGTLRVIFISKGYKKIAPVLAFFEIIIWLLAIQQIMKNLTNVFAFLGYALGFASGTYIGLLLEEKLSLGKVILRIITGHDVSKLLKSLKKEKYITTRIGAEGPDGEVQVVLTVIDRKDIKKVLDITKMHHPHAFYSIEDVRTSFNHNILGKKRFEFPFRHTHVRK